MGPTLFRYIFGDLVRVFVAATLVLAGGMSVVGLLRPLGDRGLGAVQALTVLAWLMPAMLVYSLPVAALFATSFVYGRASADNEATAAKAAGIAASPFGLLLPALVLGGGLGIATVGLLTTVVPAANLRVEQTVWENLARLVAGQINQTSRATFDGDGGRVTIFARSAYIPDRLEIRRLADRAAREGLDVADDVQVVRLEEASVVRYEDAARDTLPRVPLEFYTAAAATVFIDPPGYARRDAGSAFRQSALERNVFVITVVLEDGATFPAGVGVPGSATGGVVAGARVAQFGPIRRAVPVRTNPKFMGVGELRGLLDDPERTSRIASILGTQARADRQTAFLRDFDQHASGGGVTLDGLAPDTRSFRFDADAPGTYDSGSLAYDAVPVRLRQITPTPQGPEVVLAEASTARVRVEPLAPADAPPELLVTLTLSDATITVNGVTSSGRVVERRIRVAMPADVRALGDFKAADYLAGRNALAGGTRMDDATRLFLLRRLLGQQADVVGELHARAAFVVACTLLPLIGAGLGLMFRSGDVLAAFAVALVPAAVCIAGILLGQNLLKGGPRLTPDDLARVASLTLPTGPLVIIWAGVAVVAAFGVVLLVRLRRH